MDVNIELGLASKLFVMSLILLVGPPLKIKSSVCTEKIYTTVNVSFTVSVLTSFHTVKLKFSH